MSQDAHAFTISSNERLARFSMAMRPSIIILWRRAGSPKRKNLYYLKNGTADYILSFFGKSSRLIIGFLGLFFWWNVPEVNKAILFDLMRDKISVHTVVLDPSKLIFQSIIKHVMATPITAEFAFNVQSCGYLQQQCMCELDESWH